MPTDLDIGVIYTHEDHFMPKLLSTLAGSGEGLNFRLLLVDNASQSGCARWDNYCEKTVLISNRKQLNYAQNLNRILDHAQSDFVLLLNTDMFFDPAEQCLFKMIAFMQRHPDCGVAGCRLLHADGSEAQAARRFPQLKTIAARRLGMSLVFPKEIASHFYHEHAHDAVFPCDWLSGCFLLIRRAALADVGRLDESYPKYFEDVDFCLRMARAGWQVMYNGETFCYHLEQRSSRRVFSYDALMHLQSYARWLRKWGLQPQRKRAA